MFRTEMDLTRFDRANIFHKSFPGGARKNMIVPPPEQNGMKKLLTQIHYEDGITKPDYEVVRDWNAIREKLTSTN
jgi:hypothetical protein